MFMPMTSKLVTNTLMLEPHVLLDTLIHIGGDSGEQQHEQFESCKVLFTSKAPTMTVKHVVVKHGSIIRQGGLWVRQLQASGGISTLQSRASGLQSTTRGNSIGTTRTPPSQQTNNKWIQLACVRPCFRSRKQNISSCTG